MTLTELTTAVYELTNRPDLISQTLLAIQRSTLRAHNIDYFYKDIYETSLVFTSAEYLQQFEYKTLVPRWRSAKYLRKLDVSVTPNVAGKFFRIVSPENVLDSYCLEAEDICYVAGLVFQIKSSTEFQHALLGCYRFPDITEATFSSWIAEEYPFAIVYNAAAKIFNQIGKKDEFSIFTRMDAEEITTLKNSNIVAEGY